LGSKTSERAFEDAMAMVAVTPNNANVRDAQRMTGYAQDALLDRVRAKKLPGDKAFTFAPDDWRAAMARWAAEHEEPQ
jgi:hypothetical protein